jgi:hypothetical protein
VKLGSCLFVLAAAWAGPHDLSVVLSRSGELQNESVTVPPLDPAAGYSLQFSISAPVASTRVTVSIEQGGRPLVRKTLHTGDPDLTAAFRVASRGSARLSIAVEGPVDRGSRFKAHINRWPSSAPLAFGPAHRWEDASSIRLGEAVFGSGDETEYIPLPGTREAAVLDDPAGEHWYRFHFDGTAPRLVFFQLELTERDNVPVDVSVFRIREGRAVAFEEGADPVTPPHEVQALAGNKFTTRILREAGDYYVRVRARHPEYKLRTRVYDPPPYRDPRVAVQTAVDYIIGAGDSWHANTPRRGGVFDRVANVHQETSLCVACHPTHFSQRAQLYAVQNGYAVHQRQQLQFLAERFYNNPRPFYGFEETGAVWNRVISAPVNVLSRMSVLLDLFETNVTGERRSAYHDGVARYIDLYYKGRTELPPDETNGNTPLVSAYEVAWYAWRVTRDARIAGMVAQDHVRNMTDLCYQTLALAEIDRARYAAQIRGNADRILSMQRPDGQWAMRFEAEQPEVEFQTGHALWALQAAGIPREHPQVAKAIRYMLERQQMFGGWMDPKQSYENFRTPFRETQMAVLALSSYFPAVEPRAKGWGSTVTRLPAEPGELLEALDRVWDRPSTEVVRAIEVAASSNDAFVRQAAVEALGRLAMPSSAAVIAARLGDESKLVQRTAAWALRQVYSRHTDAPAATLVDALASKDERTRWGATRVFATHFAGLARRAELGRALLARAEDRAPTVRMQALKGLWQFWYWTPDMEVRDAIENAFLAGLKAPAHPWVERNLREGIYNIADENIRYLYNNWIPLLGTAADRERAIRGRLRVEDRLATKFAAVLEHGSDLQKKNLLAGLGMFHLRRADVYDTTADRSAPAPPVYNRIGNDTEQIVFFGAANERFAAAVLPLLDSPDAEMRRLAAPVALLSRVIIFPGVVETAGPSGQAHERLAKRLARDAEDAALAKAFYPPQKKSATVSAAAGGTGLDPEFFRERVRPILEKRGKDGYACVQCHATHTLFNGSFETAKNVVDRANPENSLLLRKPISGSESEGVLNSSTTAHGGGVRWDRDSAEYRTILQWIRGGGR